MKILFFSFYNKIDIEIHPGVGVLSQVSKMNGHETKLYPYFYYDEEDIKRVVSEYKPDIIGISATSMSEHQVKKICPFLKSITNVDIILGGIFSILEPEKALSIEGIDAVCIGEGSKGFLEYIEGKHPATNYIYKDKRKGAYECWSENPLVNIDYDLFWECSEEREIPISNKLDYWTSFTCEFVCSFCSSNKIRKTVGLKNKPRYNTSCCIEEIKRLLQKKQFKKVHFRDPLFIGVKDLEWVREFLYKYKEEINIPYTCNIRSDRFNEDIAKLLKETGCTLIKMGLESGSEYMRNKILSKGETNEQFIDAMRIIKKYGLRVSLNAMLGVPYETLETAKETVSFMKELSPDKAFLHIYQPWPGLNLKQEIIDTIMFIKAPAIDDIVSRGHKISNKKPYKYLDEEKMSKEYILTPVLNQSQFPYELALKIQSDFINGGL